jgi:hypothetical protein
MELFNIRFSDFLSTNQYVDSAIAGVAKEILKGREGKNGDVSFCGFWIHGSALAITGYREAWDNREVLWPLGLLLGMLKHVSAFIMQFKLP